MKVRNRGIDTPKPWELDLGLICGKRRREFYATKKEADDAMVEKLAELRLNGENSLALNTRLRLEYADAEERLKKLKISITQAVAHCEATYKKFTPLRLSDAINACITAKEFAGKRSIYTRKLRQSLKVLKTSFPSATTSSLTQQQVETCMRLTMPDKEGKQKPVALATVKSRLIDARTFFNFCVKQKWALENPIANIEPITLEDNPPGIHTVEQVKALLQCALEHDTALLGYLCPLYFGGMRPNEAARLTKAEVHSGIIEIQSHKAKTRRRRFVTINETLAAWLAVPGVKFGMSERARRLDTLRWILGGRKTKKGKRRPFRIKTIFPWYHDVLRHSFCSYSLPKYGAAVTAANAGHSEQILFAHYRERVKPDDVTAYWALRP